MGTLYGSLILFLYMRDINNFIIEKLRINKDSKLEKIEKKINIITDLYEVGDKCLLITNRSINRGEKIYIDVVQIIEKSKTILRYKYLTNINDDFSSHYLKMGNIDAKDIKNNKCAMYSELSSVKIIIPSDDCEKVIDELENNNMRLKFMSLWYKSNKIKENSVVVLQNKSEQLSKEKLNEIKIALDL